MVEGIKQIASYEEMSETIVEREDLTYIIDNDNFLMDEFIKKLSNGIK